MLGLGTLSAPKELLGRPKHVQLQICCTYARSSKLNGIIGISIPADYPVMLLGRLFPGMTVWFLLILGKMSVCCI